MAPRKPSEEAQEETETFLLGKISGQLRELIHTVNNISMKQDALAIRVASLEAAEQRRLGATNVINVILKSPAIGWLVGAAVSAWAVLSGKVHL